MPDDMKLTQSENELSANSNGKNIDYQKSFRKTLSSIKHPFYDQVRTLNPKKKYNFLLIFDFFAELDLYKDFVFEIYNSYPLLDKIEPEIINIFGADRLIDIPTLLSYTVKSIKEYKYETNKLSDRIGNYILNYNTNIKYIDKINLQFLELEFDPIQKFINAWINYISNPLTKVQHNKDTYTINIYKIELNDDTIRDITYFNDTTSKDEMFVSKELFENIFKRDEYDNITGIEEKYVERIMMYEMCYPTNINDYDYNNETSGIKHLNVDFNVERASDNFDFSNFLKVSNIFFSKKEGEI